MSGTLVYSFILFFTSGFVSLIYQVLWTKELGLLFGNTSQAAATTLVAFFLGLAVGGYVWGKRANHFENPLKTYALLEVGVALSALLYFLLLDAFYWIYNPLFEAVGDQRIIFLTLKFFLAVSILFLPAFFMGGTLPLMSQHCVRQANALGKTTSLLYALNTFGAAVGAYLAGFYLPPLIGFDRTYTLALILTGGVALFAWGLSRFDAPKKAQISQSATSDNLAKENLPTAFMSWNALRGMAFISGLVALSLEILWTRMFAQVLQNSVYTFSMVLVIFLVALALGGGLASFLAKSKLDPSKTLSVLLIASAILIALTPFLFSWTTEGLRYLGGKKDWTGYVLEIFLRGSSVMLVPGILLGSIFPYLMKISEPLRMTVGKTVGYLTAVNTFGAIVGSMIAGFVLMPLLGLWNSIRLMAAIYLLVVLYLVIEENQKSKILKWSPAIGLILMITVLEPSSIPLIRVDPIKKREVLYEVWEGSNGTVAVIKRKNSLKIKVNNYYSLGGTGSKNWERKQSHLPLLMHPQPKSVFYLGMGTGITAGAALNHQVERVVVSELVPEVIEASERYFQPYLNGLFTDSRAEVIAEDGRNYLLGTSENFDVVIADLFIPWRAGVGSLYSKEHFETIRDHLNENGLFAQWLPLYQLTDAEFGSIARTMIEVFPQVTLWRGDFLAKKPIAVMIGHQNSKPFPLYDLPKSLREAKVEFRQSPVGALPYFVHYAGNLTLAASLFEKYPINTDDLPLIEYQAPISHRQQKAKQSQWVVGESWTQIVDSLLTQVPPSQDPFLNALPSSQHEYPNAGLTLHKAMVAKYQGQLKNHKRLISKYEAQLSL